jgi:hypothetical protein
MKQRPCQPVYEVLCRMCGRRVYRRRPHVKTCSPRCRKDLQRNGGLSLCPSAPRKCGYSHKATEELQA